MRMAIDKAQKVGMGTVIVRHSNHLGQAGYHAETATKAGMIGVVMTNARAELAPWGAKKPVAGTNPWGLGVPRDDNFPYSFSLSLLFLLYSLVSSLSPLFLLAFPLVSSLSPLFLLSFVDNSFSICAALFSTAFIIS